MGEVKNKFISFWVWRTDISYLYFEMWIFVCSTFSLFFFIGMQLLFLIYLRSFIQGIGINSRTRTEPCNFQMEIIAGMGQIGV